MDNFAEPFRSDRQVQVADSTTAWVEHSARSAPEAASRQAELLLVRPTPVWKRVLDIVGAAAGLVLLLPVLGLAAAAIRLSSRGPVFFAQQRAGLGGRPFWIYKFRTMVVGAEQQRNQLRDFNEQDGPAFKISNDPRVTKVGHWLRRLCVDELPQLLNVLKGEMSLVGPRPLPCEEADRCAAWQRERLSVVPGMTCYWQVKDRATPVPFDEWMRMDIKYVRTRSFITDVRLLCQTILFVIGCRGK